MVFCSLDHHNNPNPYLNYEAGSNKCFKVCDSVVMWYCARGKFY